MKPVEALKDGDTFTHWHLDTRHTVTVLRAPEAATDALGRPILKVWCRTGGREGWMLYGYGASVDLI